MKQRWPLFSKSRLLYRKSPDKKCRDRDPEQVP